MAMQLILNIKPSERSKFELLLEAIIDATPSKDLDLSQARKRKKLKQIEFEWMDSYAVTNEDDEEDEEDEDEDDDEDEDGEIDDEDDDIEMKTNKSKKLKKNEYGASLKMHHPSYILGSKMAAAREVHSHRKMCDETLKRFINVKKFKFLFIFIFILAPNTYIFVKKQ